MTNSRISFSREFKQQYNELDKQERDSVDNALLPLTPVLKAMGRNDFHFHKIALRFNVRGKLGILHVSIHDNPIRAIVKNLARK